MYPHKTVGFVETVMSALSFLVVRGRPAATRRASLSVRPDSGSRTSITNALVRKESYFEMARHSRWDR